MVVRQAERMQTTKGWGGRSRWDSTFRKHTCNGRISQCTLTALLLVLLVLMVLMGVRAENVGIRWIVVRFTRKAEDQSRTKGFESK